MENLQFVLFYPVSIYIKDKSFKYGINEGTFYPCMLGIIKKDNVLIDAISGRRFNIVRENKLFNAFTEITNESKIVGSPVYVCRYVDNSLENLTFIEEYINAKGRVSSSKINKYDVFANRLNTLVSVREEYPFGKMSGFWNSLRWYESAESYLKKIDIENSKSLSTFSYIQSGQKDRDDLSEKEKIISRLKNRLLRNKLLK